MNPYLVGGQRGVLVQVQLCLAKADEADKGQLSSVTNCQAMAAPGETAGQNS